MIDHVKEVGTKSLHHESALIGKNYLLQLFQGQKKSFYLDTVSLRQSIARFLNQRIQFKVLASDLVEIVDNILAHLAAAVIVVVGGEVIRELSSRANMNFLKAKGGRIKNFLSNSLHDDRTVLLDKVVTAVLVDVPRHLLAEVVHQKLLNLLLILVVVQLILEEVGDELALHTDNISVNSGKFRLFHVVTVDVVQEALRNA